MNKLGSGAHDIVHRKADGLDKDSGVHVAVPWPQYIKALIVKDSLDIPMLLASAHPFPLFLYYY